MNRKFGICMTGHPTATVEENIAAMAHAGFRYTFIGWTEELALDERMRLFEKYGIAVDNYHVPHRGANVMWWEGNDGEIYLERMKRVIRDAGKYRVPYVVVHCTAGEPEPKPTRLGMERFREMIREGERNRVKICFENLEYPEVLGAVMYEFRNEDIGFCWDTGHEATCTPGMRFIPLFGDKLCCTHLHDNYGASYSKVPILHGDCHMLPLDGALDFKRIMADLRSVNYDGVLMIEASIRDDLGTYFDYSVEQYYTRAYAALEKLVTL